MASRFWPTRDADLAKLINDELEGNLTKDSDSIIGQEVILYRIAPYDTKTNMYGETAQGKIYKPGVQVACLISAEEQITQTDEFSPDLQQNASFSFVRQSLVDISYVVEVGDIIDWNSGYWEITSTNESQLVGGKTDYKHSVVCNAFLVRISNLNIERVRSV